MDRNGKGWVLLSRTAEAAGFAVIALLGQYQLLSSDITIIKDQQTQQNKEIENAHKELENVRKQLNEHDSDAVRKRCGCTPTQLEKENWNDPDCRSDAKRSSNQFR